MTGALNHNIAALRDGFRAQHPRTRVFYAGKACSNLWFLDRARRAGIDAEVSSGGEPWKVRKVGFEPRQIVFNGVAKTRDEIEAALQPPAEAIVVDSVFELRRVAEVAADLGAERGSRCASTSTRRARRTRACARAWAPRPAST